MRGTGIASDKQVAFITKLATERNQPIPTDLAAYTMALASKTIEKLLAMPKPEKAPSPDAVTEVGIYRNDAGDVFKVRKSKSTGNLYAEKLAPIGGQRLAENGATVHWTFQYAPGAIKSLTKGMRLTLDEAKKFGILYGVCIVCGKTLVDARSVANGIGPVCAKRV